MAFTIASTSHSSLQTRGEFATKVPSAERSLTSRYLLRSSSNGLKVKAAKKGVSSVCEPLPADRPVWFPGKSPPEWLDGSLPGDFGFDPLGLGSDPETLKWFAQAELMHSRWAMLAVAGILIPEWLESLGFVDNFSWFDAGSREYFADSTTLFVVQLALMGWVEGRRWADIINPGSVDIEPNFPNRKRPKPDVGYPGGLWFDPFMWGRGSPEPVMVLRTKEIKNGRLAMLAFTGFVFQAIYTGQGPLENLSAHLADPGLQLPNSMIMPTLYFLIFTETVKVDRPISTAIYFFLPTGNVSNLHRIPSAETWHFYLGEPITILEIDDKNGSVKFTNMGQDILSNQVLQYTVRPDVWFGAFPSRDFDVVMENKLVKKAPRDAEKHFSLVGTTVAPAFEVDDFVLAKRSKLISRFPALKSLISVLTPSD
ncbi:photosystem I chlorophyll a/b-binding protein 6, chloroplastic [Tanacetum coccineum]|uniref:Chlorophyll a-b binding protein, chloroplastic n=1 Tax=Tanacetum coccineum TaxID=301880 RepID=A0ABQ5I7D3_9ASTR